MLVRDLIAALQGMPQDAEVLHYQRETDTHHSENAPINYVLLDVAYVKPIVLIS